MDDYVKSIQDSLKESREFFSNSKKQERELWVIREFLSYLPINVIDSNIASSSNEPNDVCYGPYSFQVKEVLSDGRTRGKEYIDDLASITEDTKPEDLLEPYISIHIPLEQSLPRMVSELARHREEKYKNKTSDLDVLVYLNLSNTTYTHENIISAPSEFCNWQSVSVVSNNCAIVLSCTDENNQLLRPLLGKLYVKK